MDKLSQDNNAEITILIPTRFDSKCMLVEI